MSTVLIASPSAFLRTALAQQLRQRWGHTLSVETATATEAARIVAGGGINLAIVDNVLLTSPTGDGLLASIQRYLGCALVIVTRDQAGVPPASAGALRVICGVVDGTLDMGAIAALLPAALDDVAVQRGIRSAPVGPPLVPIAHRRGAHALRRRPELILLAASTGGPSAITLLLRHLGVPKLPMIIAQHMPADQTAGFARYLAAESGFDVIERSAGELPPNAQVVVLRGGTDYRLVRACTGRVRLVATEIAGNLFHPSADLLFSSAAEVDLAVIAVVLSGMGEDGARGAADIAARGGRVLAQDFASCVVAGMPSAARAICPSVMVASVPEIAERLSRWSMAPAVGAAAIAEG